MWFKKTATTCLLASLISLLPLHGIAQTGTSSPTNPLAGYRFSPEEMSDIANPQKLSHRIFYTPSKGPDAAWFDAVKKGDLETVKKMVAAGQNLEVKDEASQGQTALGWAAFIGYEDMVVYLVEQGADLFATDRADVKSTLKSAALGKNANVVRYLHNLLRDKIDLNDATLDSEGETLLMIASSNNRIEVAQYLISQGADVNAISTQIDQSPLTYACKGGYTDMVNLLIKAGAVNHRTGKPSC